MSEKWQLKMKRQQELKKKGINNLFERVRLLVECYHDEEFIAECEARDTPAIGVLDGELADTGRDFLLWLAIYDAYPKKQTWQDMGVQNMIAEIMSKRSKEPRKTVSYKDLYEQAQREIRALQSKIEVLEDLLKTPAS